MKRPQIGVLGDLVSDASNIVKVADFGLPCTQVCCWNMDFCTRDMARKVRDVAAGCGVRLTALWAGYSGPREWNFTRGPVTLGLVPPAYRQKRVEDLRRWADFAAEAGAPAIITHCGFLPPTDGCELGREVKVGTGFVRYLEFIPKLLGCGFDGDITIEREIKGSAQDRDIRDTIGYLSGILDGCCGF